MSRKLLTCAAVVELALGTIQRADAQVPTKVGTCTQTTISRIGTRFSDKLVKPKNGDMDEGTSVLLANGVYGVSYEYVAALANLGSETRC